MGEFVRHLPASVIGPVSDTKVDVPSHADLRPRASLITVFPHPEDAQTFVEPREDGRTFVFVPPDVRMMGSLLRQARELHRVALYEIARGVKIDGTIAKVGYIEDFENGKYPDPDVGKIIKAAEIYIDSEDDKMLKMKELHKRREEEKKWIRKLGDEKIPLGDAIRFIRLSGGYTKSRLVKELPDAVSYSNLQYVEQNKHSPSLYMLNRIVEKTGFDTKYRKTTQLLRLKIENDENQYPIALGDVEGLSFGQLVRYLRIQNGFTLEQFRRKSGGKSANWHSELELEKQKSIPTETMEGVLRALAIPDTLVEFVKQKAEGKNLELTNEMRQAFLDHFFFTDHFELGSSAHPDDQKLAKELRTESVFGQAFKKMRLHAGFSQSDFSKDQSFISKIEMGIRKPEDYIIAQLVMEMGYSVLDESTQVLFDLSTIAKSVSKRGFGSKFSTQRTQE